MEHQDKLPSGRSGTSTWETVKQVMNTINKVIDIVLTVLFRLRKVFLSIPVVYYAIKLAKYNMENLPTIVGVDLQANGAFAHTISREMAVMGPLGVTAVCLLLMFLSRKALPAWAVSVFSLAIPLLVLISNRYPA